MTFIRRRKARLRILDHGFDVLSNLGERTKSASHERAWIKPRTIWVMGIFLTGLPTVSGLEVIKKHNALAEIERAEGRIQLKLLREWGGEKETDANKMFFEPNDLACDKPGNIYVLETRKILTFDKNANFKRKIGGPGQGPGEFLGAYQLLIDPDNSLVVYDSDNRRIQILGLNGEMIGNVPLSSGQGSQILVNKNKEIVMVNSERTAEPSSLWQFIDYKGKLLREAGIRPKVQFASENSRRFAFTVENDRSGKIFAAAQYESIINVYSPSGELEKRFSYELPFEVPEIKGFLRLGREFVDCEMTSRGIAIDSKKRIFILAYRRLMNLEEKNIGTYWASSNGSSGRTPAKVDASGTGLFQILIFDESGKIVSSNKLDFYANKIRIFNDRLFIIDSYVNMNIHEYQIAN